MYDNKYKNERNCKYYHTCKKLANYEVKYIFVKENFISDPFYDIIRSFNSVKH